MSKSIHIVTLDVPYPLNYGGAIDMFYRIKALHALGYEITLHCFEYGRGEQKELEKYTNEVIYYPRKKSVLNWLSSTPFIVKSRHNNHLLQNLKRDDSPILFEGIHTTSFLTDAELKNRIKLVRCHNIEHDYYNALAQRASGLKSIFYKSEAKKLAKYEAVLSEASALLVIQNKDLEHFNKINPNTHLLPASLPEIEVTEHRIVKDYMLFHGNLSVSENDHAAQWIIQNVSAKVEGIPVIIAGLNPSLELQNLCAKNEIDLRSNLSQEEMDSLVSEAKIHLLYTNQATGLKLKLLSALQSNGAVIVNSEMISGTDLGEHCLIANTANEFVKYIQDCNLTPLDTDTISTRISKLNKTYNTVNNCKLIETLCLK